MRSGLAKRASWSLADQVLSSSTNLGLSVLVANTASASEFGVFALGYALYLFSAGLQRSFTGEPYSVLFAGDSRTESERVVPALLGTASLYGLGVGGAAALGVAVIGRGHGSLFLVLALCLPGLLLQDAGRQVLLASRRQQAAFTNDLAWAALLVALVLVLRAEFSLSATTATAAWGIAGSVAGLVGIWQLSCTPAFSDVPFWLRSVRRFAPSFSLEFLVSAGAQQASVYLIGGIVGLAGVGALRAAQVAFGPLNSLYVAVALVGTAELKRHCAGDPKPAVSGAAFLAGVLSLVTCAWAAGLMVLGPTLGPRTLGDAWAGSASLLLPIALMKVGQSLADSARVGIRVLEMAHLGLYLRGALAVVRVLIVALLARYYGLTAAIWGTGCVGLIGGCVWWVSLVRVRSRLTTREVILV